MLRLRPERKSDVSFALQLQTYRYNPLNSCYKSLIFLGPLHRHVTENALERPRTQVEARARLNGHDEKTAIKFVGLKCGRFLTFRGDVNSEGN